jgi:hypothetical protein
MCTYACALRHMHDYLLAWTYLLAVRACVRTYVPRALLVNMPRMSVRTKRRRPGPWSCRSIVSSILVASQLTVRLLHHIRNDPLQWSLLTGRYLSCTRSYRRSPCQRRRRGITSEIDRRRYLHVRRSCVWEAAASQQTRHGTVVRPPGSSHARASGWQQRTHQERAAERATQITSLRSSQSSRRRAKRGEARGTDRSRTRALPLPVVPTPRRRPARGEGAPLPPVPAPFPNWAALPASATHVGVGCRPRVSNSGLSVRSQLAVNIARHMTTRLHAMSVCARAATERRRRQPWRGGPG